MITLHTRAALRARPYRCQTSATDKEPGMLLCVKDTSGLIQSSFVAVWRGPAALNFCREHAAELVAGRCLDIEVSRLRTLNNQLRADVQLCALAPLAPSWKTPAASTPASEPTDSAFSR